MNPEDLLAVYRNDFRAFLHVAFLEAHPGQPFVDSWHLDVMADALMAHPPDSGGRLMLNAPPRSLKSFCVSVAWPLFLLGRHAGLRVTVIAGTQELAADLAEVRERLLRSSHLLAIFPNLRFVRNADVLKFDSGGRLTQTFLGRSQIGRGADIVIIDDPLSPMHAAEEGRRRAVNQWYAAEVAPRLNHSGSVVVVVMQRLHVDDLCGYLLKGPERWRRVALSAIAKDDESWPLTDGRLLLRRRGEPLCPARADVPDLRGRLYRAGAMNFSAQYLQDPMDLPIGTTHYIDVRAKIMAPLPGFEHVKPPRMGFIRIPLEQRILVSHFGYKDPTDGIGFRPATLDQWENIAKQQQARLVEEVQESEVRRRGGDNV